MPPSHSHPSQPIYVVCALADEAQQFLAAFGKNTNQTVLQSAKALQVVQTGLGSGQIIDSLRKHCSAAPAAIVVAGTAGGLNSNYRPGDTVVFSSVTNESGISLPLSNHWVGVLDTALATLQPKRGVGYTSAEAVTTVSAKTALRTKHHVDCVDMETATIIEFAIDHAIPIAAFRVIVDPHDQAVPSAALAGLKIDGTTDIFATISSLIKGPQQLPEIIRLAFQYRQAIKTLTYAAKLLSQHFAESAMLEGAS